MMQDPLALMPMTPRGEKPMAWNPVASLQRHTSVPVVPAIVVPSALIMIPPPDKWRSTRGAAVVRRTMASENTADKRTENAEWRRTARRAGVGFMSGLHDQASG